VLARLGAWTARWFALFWLWLLLTGDWNRIELIGAACGAALAATIAELLRPAARQPLPVPLERFRTAASLVPIVFADFGIVMWALLGSLARRRVVRGAFVTRNFDAGPKTTPHGQAHRAWTILVAGFSPNAYVIDIDAERDTVLLHDLVTWRRSDEPA
jgi:predicted lysophospholipase L1 biosynthesis ABC-type transport system permease subunit